MSPPGRGRITLLVHCRRVISKGRTWTMGSAKQCCFLSSLSMPVVRLFDLPRLVPINKSVQDPKSGWPKMSEHCGVAVMSTMSGRKPRRTMLSSVGENITAVNLMA